MPQFKWRLVDFAREMKSDLLRGFDSDDEWIEVIKDMAAGFVLDLEAFQKHLEDVERTWGDSEKVMIFNKWALKGSLKYIARLKECHRAIGG